MTDIGCFQKVSFDQFYNDMKATFALDFEPGEDFHKLMSECWEELDLPDRATSGSAGYDFKAPFDFELDPGEDIKIPTGIRVLIDDGWFLAIVPRSGLGFKYKLRLANTVGIIDSDYSNSDNEGHIFLKFCNEGDRVVKIAHGDGIAQGIFLPYGLVVADDTTSSRNGGFGSTDK